MALVLGQAWGVKNWGLTPALQQAVAAQQPAWEALLALGLVLAPARQYNRGSALSGVQSAGWLVKELQLRVPGWEGVTGYVSALLLAQLSVGSWALLSGHQSSTRLEPGWPLWVLL